jgi:hypothetical protein
MENRYTPGPWKVDTTWGLVMHGKEEICAIHSGNKANQSLLAAAPDLLDACRYALMTIETRLKHRKDLFTDDEINVLRKAIRKAEGGQE